MSSGVTSAGPLRGGGGAQAGSDPAGEQAVVATDGVGAASGVFEVAEVASDELGEGPGRLWRGGLRWVSDLGGEADCGLDDRRPGFVMAAGRRRSRG
jgi:hypothetical protein